jgi:hypothetical protein
VYVNFIRVLLARLFLYVEVIIRDQVWCPTFLVNYCSDILLSSDAKKKSENAVGSTSAIYRHEESLWFC